MTKFRRREKEVFLLKPNRTCTIWTEDGNVGREDRY